MAKGSSQKGLGLKTAGIEDGDRHVTNLILGDFQLLRTELLAFGEKQDHRAQVGSSHMQRENGEAPERLQEFRTECLAGPRIPRQILDHLRPIR